MNITIQLNARGTLTLPKTLRKSIGLERGGMLVAESTAEGILLRPGVAFPLELYSDDRVAEFDAADAALGAHLKKKQK